MLILQVTFTDAAMTAEIAQAFDGPLAVWAVPEPRLGGRLRLNALCGLNLAAHTLGLAGRAFGALYADPAAPGIGEELEALLSGQRDSIPRQFADAAPPTATAAAAGRRAVETLAGSRIGRIGRHPDGFSTCAYDAGRLAALAGVAVEEISLDSFFARAAAVGRGAPSPSVPPRTKSPTASTGSTSHSSTGRCACAPRSAPCARRATSTPSPSAAGRKRSPNMAVRSAAPCR